MEIQYTDNADTVDNAIDYLTTKIQYALEELVSLGIFLAILSILDLPAIMIIPEVTTPINKSKRMA
jgi:hypothetical protein